MKLSVNNTIEAARTEVPPYTDGCLRVADGLTLAYRDYAPVGGRAVGVPILCLHGLTRNARDFEELAPRLAALGRRVIVAEQRGRGRSEWDPDPSRYHPATYAGDMTALLDALALDRVVVVGTSMGGIMAMVMAAADRGRFGGVVLNDIGPAVALDGLLAIKGYVGEEPDAATWAAAAAYVRGVHTKAFPKETGDAFWMTFARRLFREDDAGAIRLDYDPAIAELVRAGEAAPAGLWDAFDAFAPARLLLVRGAVSSLLEASTVAEMRARRPDMDFVEAPDVGHTPFLTEPAVWPVLERFITACE